MDPFDPQELTLFRDRILTEVIKSRGARNNAAHPNDVEALFNKTALVSNKANVLLRAIEPVANKFFIPVHEQAVDVRSAVTRKSADTPDGSRISFDLYKEAIDFMQDLKKEKEPHMLLSRGIEPASVFSKRMTKIKARMCMKYDGVQDPEELAEMLVSQFMVLFLLHFLMKPFNNMLDLYPHEQTVLPKVPDPSPGSPLSGILIQMAIGFAVQLIIMGLNEELLETYLDKSAGQYLPPGTTSKDIISQAKAQLDPKIRKLIEQHAGLNDYEIILRYSADFLSSTIDPGYEFWTAYLDVVHIRSWTQSMWIYAPHYSIPHAIYALEKQGKLQRNKLGDSGYDRRQDIMLQKAILNGLVPMANPTYLARLNAVDSANDNLNIVAQVLGADFMDGVVCCLASKVGRIPTKTIKVIKGMLEGLMRAHAFDWRNSIQAIFAHLYSPNFEEIVALEATYQIDRIFNQVNNRVVGLFGDNFRALLCCPLLGEMIQAVLKFLARLENELKTAVKLMSGKLAFAAGFGSNDVFRRYEIQYEQRILRKMIQICDAVLELAHTTTQCSNPWTTQPVSDNINAAILNTLVIPEADRTHFFLDATGKELSTGKFIPTLGEQIKTTVADPIQTSVDDVKGLHTCGSPATELDLKGIEDAFIRK